MKGDAQVVEALLASSVNPSLIVSVEGWGKTCALREAIRSEQFSIALRLMGAGADIHQSNEQGRNIITLALELYGKRLKNEAHRVLVLDLIKELLANGAKPLPGCLILAAGSVDLEMVRLLLASGVDVNGARFEDGKVGKLMVPDSETALARAVNLGWEQVVVELLRAGANPNVEIPLKGPCVNVAVARGQTAIVKALVEAGADLNKRASVTIGNIHSGRVRMGEDRGNIIVHTPAVAREATPLIIAVRRSDRDMVHLLVDAGADINEGDAEGLTPLAWAVRLKHESIAGYLRSKSADEARLNGNPLHRLYNASVSGDLDELNAAIVAGADVNGSVERRGTSYTALMRAARAGRCDVIRILVQAGADPNLAGRENVETNITPLMLASRRGHKDAVELLLQAGAKTGVRIGSVFGHRAGQNAMQQARDKGRDEIVKVLRTAAKSEKGKR